MPREWVALTGRDTVAPGDVVAVDEHDVVVWSTAAGRVCVMDARCPHQWSHLGAEGAVVGEELVCASHFWRFDAEGNGAKLSMNGRRDVKAPIDVFPSREVDGRIYALIDDDRGCSST